MKVEMQMAIEIFGVFKEEELLEHRALAHVADDDKLEVAMEFAYRMIQSGDEYCDNWRIFPEERLDEYNAVASRGCCGFADWQFVSPVTKKRYYLGYNYGH